MTCTFPKPLLKIEWNPSHFQQVLLARAHLVILDNLLGLWWALYLGPARDGSGS